MKPVLPVFLKLPNIQSLIILNIGEKVDITFARYFRALL
tara:strand:+ start:2046 stop:2162 length:117 start_codon:yes stop_codon:yes gene_type:complete